MNNKVYPTNYKPNNEQNKSEDRMPLKLLLVMGLMCIIFGFL